jgi:hypothetical protein
MLNFPSSPTLNQEYIYDNRTWVWNGVGWALKPFVITGYQPTLISGTNIKTVNGQSVLGSGDIQIGGGVTSFNTRTGNVVLNRQDVLSAVEYATYSMVLGNRALERGGGGNFSVAIGSHVYFWTTGATSHNCTAVGSHALLHNNNDNNTGVGYGALAENSTFSNCTGIGNLADVTGSNQVQLGNSATTTYVYGTVQNRSDLRDKTDVRNTLLGLSFINALRPVDYRWDMREDYKPARPATPPEDATEAQIASYKASMDAWLVACKYENLNRDGSKKRVRYHHGLIAQEVKAVMVAQGIDFGGYQNHTHQGGEEVLSIGYDELIAPLIKAVQELSARVQALEAFNMHP